MPASDCGVMSSLTMQSVRFGMGIVEVDRFSLGVLCFFASSNASND
jgi:hypothetical protein